MNLTLAVIVSKLAHGPRVGYRGPLGLRRYRRGRFSILSLPPQRWRGRSMFLSLFEPFRGPVLIQSHQQLFHLPTMLKSRNRLFR